MDTVMDNCCGCGPGGPGSAAVEADFFWPGFLPFNTLGPGNDSSGVRYLDMRITSQNLNGQLITKSIHADKFTGTLTDTLTGTSADADGPFFTGAPFAGFAGSLLPSWPPDVISVDGTTANWIGVAAVALSNPIGAAWCKQQAQLLLDSLDVLTLNVNESKIVTYQPLLFNFNLPAGNLYTTSQSLDWLAFGIVMPAEDPPGSGIFPQFYAWFSATTGALLTYAPSGPTGMGPLVPDPFVNLPPVIQTGDNSIEFPISAGAFNAYEQLNNWKMRKSYTTPAPPSNCITDTTTIYNQFGPVPGPPDACSLQAANADGKLVLNPPPLAFVQANPVITVVRLPLIGGKLSQSLSGCPCVPGP